MAAGPSWTVRYAVSPRMAVVVVVLMGWLLVPRSTGTSTGSTPSASSSRRRSASRKGSRGAMGSSGVRNCSRGSGIGSLLPVDAAEGNAGSDQERLRRVDSAVENLRDLRHRQAVEVAQGQRDAV